MRFERQTSDEVYAIEPGLKNAPYYHLVSSHLDRIDMPFDSIEAAKKYAKSRGFPLTGSDIN